MIHACMVNGELVLMTRKGHTDVAMQAEMAFLGQDRYVRFITELLERGFTPIFEYTAPNNRIVIEYAIPSLTLLAVRDMGCGDYMNYNMLYIWAQEYNVPVVMEYRFDKDPNLSYTGHMMNILEMTRTLKDKEGFVIQFHSGHMLKMKADEYVRKHRAIDSTSSKKRAVELIINDGIDDILPMLSDKDKQALIGLNSAVHETINSKASFIEQIVLTHNASGMDRKHMALNIVPTAKMRNGDWIASCIFSHLDGDDAKQLVTAAILKNPSIVKCEWRGEV
jgi:RNA ligase